MLETSSVENLFAQEVEDTRKKARGFYVQSIVMLVIGFAIGVFGIVLFVWMSSDVINPSGIIRTTGIFLFIEAIAWFFFRQYAELRKHHERFYKNYYMNRVNYLIAFKDMEAKQYNPSNTLMATTLIKQANDIHEHQNNDGSISNSEGLNPVFNLLRAGIEQMSSALKKETDK